MGTGGKQTGPAQAGAASTDHRRSQGGQRSITLFGCPGLARFTSQVKNPAHPEVLAAQSQAQPPSAPLSRQPDPRDRALVDDHLASLSEEQLERMEEEAAYRAATTPAMRAAAAAADERESRRTDEDDAADFWQRASGHEDIAIRLAIED